MSAPFGARGEKCCRAPGGGGVRFGLLCSFGAFGAGDETVDDLFAAGLVERNIEPVAVGRHNRTIAEFFMKDAVARRVAGLGFLVRADRNHRAFRGDRAPAAIAAVFPGLLVMSVALAAGPAPRLINAGLRYGLDMVGRQFVD